ncbi:MAG TPA: ABC transporter permease [Thermoanaerobaculales bacterium]|nr:ABC transporter permease [Thermoanaerobaculales bacterium]HPA79531.1 ABC transporter permease [Thermoanaerobaculales bacterium]HQL30429.1 ABC transporter permease [Thermoanaerobaculales bacterium]HQN95096.1 ABC transporter permease [Thermoanaerobaculales bacterium]HQP43424.1 ABC transporter permease [Thermoanaerobaculales bacterium]
MKSRDLSVTWSLFVRASSLQRKRAMLTVAAIAWGTVAIVLLLAFGEGLGRQMMRGRLGMGENIAVWWPGETSKVWQGLPTGRPIRPRIDDIPYLRSRLPDLEGVVGEIVSWQTPVSWGPKDVNVRVIGANAEYGEIRHHFACEGGRFFNFRDEAEKRRVVFLGDEIARDIFGEVDPVGQVLDIGGSPFLVIGVLQKRLQMGTYGGPDASHAVIPITTFAAVFGRQELNNIVIKVARPELMGEALERFADALAARYRFDPTDQEVMQVWDTAKGAQIMDNIMLGLEIFLGIIGGLTLLIGGIGVANIMYAVVKEKTREIGVQMALGAHRGWITGPFVLQGLAYTLVGGLVGLVIATVIIVLLGFVPVEGNEALEFLGKPTLSWQIAAVTALVLGGIGILAGYFPARRAASIDPAETLRYE